MTEQDIEKIMNALRSETLKAHELLTLRRQLELFMREHPLRVPLHIRLLDRMTSIRLPSFVHPQQQLAVLALMALLFTGLGTAYAAEGALPGDALYGVKIRVNEPVMGVVAFSDSAKASWSAQLAGRRLEEAETLAAEGRLSDSDSALIASQIKATTDQFDKHLAMLSKVKGNDALVADARSDMDTSLKAHENVLTTLSVELPDVKQAIEPVISSIQQDPVVAVAAASSTPGIPNTGDNNDDKKALFRMTQKRAQSQLDDMRSIAASLRDNVGTTTFDSMAETASSSQKSIDESDHAAQSGEYDSALRSLNAMIQRSKETAAGLRAHSHMKRGTQAAPEASPSPVVYPQTATSTLRAGSDILKQTRYRYPHDTGKKARNDAY